MKKEIKDYSSLAKNLVAWISNMFYTIEGKAAIVNLNSNRANIVTTKLLIDALGVPNVYAVINTNKSKDKITEIAEVLGLKNCINVDMNLSYAAAIATTMLSGNNKANRLRVHTEHALTELTASAIINGISEEIDNCVVVSTLDNSRLNMGNFIPAAEIGYIAPVANITSTELISLGKELGIPEEILTPCPIDSMTGQTDEAIMGFKYSDVDTFIRSTSETEELSEGIKIALAQRMQKMMYKKSLFSVPSFHGLNLGNA
jgi:NAD+ synthase